MRTYQTRTNDGRIFYVVAYTKSEVPALMQEQGVEREEIDTIQRDDRAEYTKARKQRVLIEQ